MTDSEREAQHVHQQERLNDLLRRRANVYSPDRGNPAYYGDDDIDLLRHLLDEARAGTEAWRSAAAQHQAERNEAYTKFHAAEEEIARLRAEVARLTTTIERDRSEVAKGVTDIKRAIASRDWLREGRGGSLTTTIAIRPNSATH